MNLQPEGFAAVLDRAVWPAPARDGWESARVAVLAYGPVIQDRRLPRWPPTNVSPWNPAVAASDVFANRKVIIMAREPRGSASRGVPELGKARIKVEEGLPADPAPQRFHAE